MKKKYRPFGEIRNVSTGLRWWVKENSFEECLTFMRDSRRSWWSSISTLNPSNIWRMADREIEADDMKQNHVNQSGVILYVLTEAQHFQSRSLTN